MKTTETPFNAPVKNCATCAHRHGMASVAKCAKAGFVATEYSIIACKTEWWQPRPPKPIRRSLRQWIMDTFWKTEP